MTFIDSHIHLDDEAFDQDRERIIGDFDADGIEFVVNQSTNIQTINKVLELTEKYEKIYGVVGFHPHDAESFEDEYLDVLREYLKRPKILGVGEVGLDYHYDFADRDTQKDVFKKMIELANETNSPLVIHSRDAYLDTYNMLKEFRKSGNTLLHCFTGSKEVAFSYFDLGYYISVGGAVTFKNAKHVVETVREMPLDRLLLETDAPYMTPVPFRGKRNEPKYIDYVINKIAEIRGKDPEEIAFITTQNAKRFYKFDEKD